MKENNRHDRIVNNSFTIEWYIRFFAAIEILLAFLYAKYLATFSIYGSRIWFFTIIIFVFAVIGLVLSWKLERNWISLVSGTILPVLLYEFIGMWKYSLAIRIIGVVGGIMAIIVGCYWANKKTRRVKRISIRREVFVIKAARASRIVCCVVLLVTCVVGKVLIQSHYTVSYSDIAYLISDTNNDIEDYENSLTANIATVAKIDPDGGWGSLAVSEKTEVLETIIRVECRYLGMRDSALALELAYLEEGLLGEYDNEKDQITLSYNHVVDSGSSGYSVVQVLCHEVYHRYQRYQANLLQEIRDGDNTSKHANLLIFDDAGIYEEEFSSYYSPKDDSVLSYYLYSSQSLERDAEKYANASTVDYYKQIQTYFEGN